MTIDSVWGGGLSPQDLYCSLLMIYKTSKEMKTKEMAVRCLRGSVQLITVGIVDFIKSTSIRQGAHCMSHSYTFVDGGTQAVPQFECSSIRMITKDISGSKALVSIWLDIAKVHSEASEAVNFRRAASEAIVASGILKDAELVGHIQKMQVTLGSSERRAALKSVHSADFSPLFPSADMQTSSTKVMFIRR